MSPLTTAVAWSSTRSRAWIPPLTWPAMTASWVCRSPSITAPAATSTWAPTRTVPSHPALDPDDALGLEVTHDGHVAGDDRERYLIGPAPPELVALLVPRRHWRRSPSAPSLTMVLRIERRCPPGGSRSGGAARWSARCCRSVRSPPAATPCFRWSRGSGRGGRTSSGSSSGWSSSTKQSVLRVLTDLVDRAPAGSADELPVATAISRPGCASSEPPVPTWPRVT